MQEDKEPSKLEARETDRDGGPFQPGNVLGGKYKVISVLGKGGMGTVYKVLQVFLNKEFAIKVLDSRRVSDDLQVRRFQLEAKAAHSLNDPALVKVHDFGLLDNNQPYLVMDLVEGKTLTDYIKENRNISVNQVEAIFSQVCRGLAYAHEQSVVHRDIKPSNIMIVNGVPLGVEGSIKILDFGIAKIASDEAGEIQQLTRTGEIFGSPLYMSPEQCTGDLVDHRSDIYSLGCVIFEALTGTPPHFGSNALRTMMMHQSEPTPLLREASLGHTYPEALEHIVQKMLQKSPKDRYQNLSQVIDALSEAATNGALLADKVSTSQSGSKAVKTITMSLPALYALFTAAILVSALATTLISYGSERPNDQNENAPVPVALVPKASPPDDSRHNAAEDFLNLERGVVKWEVPSQPIKAVIVDTPIGKQREFHFPKYPMGIVSTRFAIERGIWKGEPIERTAMGKVLAPANIPLTFRLNNRTSPAPFENIAIFNAIDPTDFTELEVTGNPLRNHHEQALAIESILSIAQKWTNLESFALYSVDENDGTMKQMSQLKNLHHLLLQGMSIEKAETFAPEFWQKLKSLTLANALVTNNDGTSPSDSIISMMANSRKLERLIFELTNISPVSLTKLRSCPQLNYVCIHYRFSISDELLDALLKLPKLKTLELKTLVVTPQQFKQIANSSNLKQIIVDESSKQNFESSKCNDARVRFVKQKIQNE